MAQILWFENFQPEDTPVLGGKNASLGTLTGAGLPTSYRAGAWPALRKAMAVDKKARGAVLRFVVLGGLARPVILADPPEDLLERAYAEVTSR